MNTPEPTDTEGLELGGLDTPEDRKNQKTLQERLAHHILNNVYQGNNHCFLFGDAIDIAKYVLSNYAPKTTPSPAIERARLDEAKFNLSIAETTLTVAGGDGTVKLSTLVRIQTDRVKHLQAALDKLDKEQK